MQDLSTIVNGLNDFKEKRTWVFPDSRKRKAGQVRFFDANAKLHIRVYKDDPNDFLKRFSYGTAKTEYSRLNLYSITGHDRLSFLRTKTEHIEFNSDLFILQTLDNGDIPDKIKNIRCDLPGIHTFLDKNLLEFDNVSRQFKEKSNWFFNIEIQSFGTIFLRANLDIPYQLDGTFKAVHLDTIEFVFVKELEINKVIYCLKRVEEFFNLVFKEQTNQIFFKSNKTRPKKKFDSLLEIVSSEFGSTYQFPRRDSQYSLLFGFNDISDDTLRTMFQRWFLGYESIQEVWESLKIIRNGNISEKSKFLSLISSLESFHKHFLKPITNEQKGTYKLWINSVLSDLSPEDKNRLKKLTIHGYEYSLSQKIKDVEEFCSDFGIPKFDQGIISKIVATRHNHVHALKLNQNKLLSEVEQLKTNMLLEIYIKIALLSILGVSKEELTKIIQEKSEFKIYF